MLVALDQRQMRFAIMRAGGVSAPGVLPVTSCRRRRAKRAEHGSTSIFACLIAGPLLIRRGDGLAVGELDQTEMLSTIPLTVALLYLAVEDYRNLRLPDVITLPLIATGITFSYVQFSWDGLADAVLGACLAGTFGLSVALSYRLFRRRDGLGLGDVKLMAAGGAWLGWQSLPVYVAIATFVALSFALVTRWERERPLPFGTFLCLSFIILWLMQYKDPAQRYWITL